MDIAKKVIISHHQAINEGDTEAYLNTICFPFTFHRYDGHFYRVANSENYKNEHPMRWEVIKSNTQLAYKLVARRINSEGKTSTIFQAIWVLGQIGDTWGVQTRYNLGIFNGNSPLAA